MNFSKSYKMMPILLGLSTNVVMAKTELLFSESDIIKANYLASAKSSIVAEHELMQTSQIYMKYKFDDLYKKWNENTMFYSSPKMIIEDENFQGILSMGDQAIPLILNMIENEPSQLVWALNILTNKKISQSPMVSIQDSCKRWVKFAKQSMI